MDDQELGNLLAAVGNHEAKAITIAAMREGVIYSMRDLYRLMMDGQGQLLAWRLSYSVPFDYCKHSLAPIGLVAAEICYGEGLSTYGYMKTRYGRDTGDALAGHLLSFSEEFEDISLLQVFGNTNSSSPPSIEAENGDMAANYRIRSPYRRYKILAAILGANLPMRQLDLGHAIHEEHHILEPHLRNLARNDVITYRTKHLGDSYVNWKISGDLSSDIIPLDPRAPALTGEVAEVFLDNSARDMTRDQVYDALVERYKYRKLQNSNNVKTMISKVLSHLARHGIVEREKLAVHTQLECDLTARQRYRLSGLL